MHEDIENLFKIIRPYVAGQEAEQALNELYSICSLDQRMLGQYEKLIDTIPECPEHGRCIPHAIRWAEAAEEVMEPLVPTMRFSMVNGKFTVSDSLSNAYGISFTPEESVKDYLAELEDYEATLRNDPAASVWLEHFLKHSPTFRNNCEEILEIVKEARARRASIRDEQQEYVGQC